MLLFEYVDEKEHKNNTIIIIMEEIHYKNYYCSKDGKKI